MLNGMFTPVRQGGVTKLYELCRGGRGWILFPGCVKLSEFFVGTKLPQKVVQTCQFVDTIEYNQPTQNRGVDQALFVDKDLVLNFYTHDGWKMWCGVISWNTK